MTSEPRFKVVLYQRKPRHFGNYSFENIFDEISKELMGEFDFTTVTAPCLSNGILPRLRIMIDAFFNQGNITHVTGDINFATLLLDSATTILTVHDLNELLTNGPIRRYFWVDGPLKHLNWIATVSEFTKSEIYRKTAFDKEIFVTPPLIRSVYYSLRQKGADELRCSPRKKVIFIGSSPNKNLPTAIDALAGMDVEFTIVGNVDPCLSQRARELVAKCNICENLSDQALLQKYQESDLLLFPSTHEGFGMPIIEAQCAGVPVITSTNSSMPEVAGKGAILIDADNPKEIRYAIDKVLNSPDLFTQLIKLGYENVERYSRHSIGASYSNMYHRVHLATLK